MQYFVTVHRHSNNDKGKWVAENIYNRLNETIVSDTNLPEMRKWIEGVIEDAKKRFPRCKVDLIGGREMTHGSVAGGRKYITYQTRKAVDYPDVEICMVAARVELF